MVTDSRLLHPKAHRFRDVVADKQRRVHDSHVAPLTRLVEEINEGRGHRAPWFDPDGGGTGARVLFLHENPGRKATSERESGSGFISADNNDDTAANFFRMRDQAGLPRDQLVAWNVVPWYQPNGDRTAKRHPAGRHRRAALARAPHPAAAGTAARSHHGRACPRRLDARSPHRSRPAVAANAHGSALLTPQPQRQA
jgi:hypothetical protein